jgi:S-disulfanyl-L-cysteine oxidoreductase SoxD
MRRVLAGGFLLLIVISARVIVSGQAPAAASRTVWDGVFSAAQAERGRNFYAADCAECHGPALMGGAEGKALRGDQFWTDWREDTVGSLLAYVSKNMPRSEDGSTAGTLSPSTYADIIAFILSSNEFPAGGQELTAASSAGVQIIRKEGPGELPATTLARVIGCLAPRGADGSWTVTRATRPVRTATAGAPDKTASGDRTFQLKFVLTSLTRYVGHRVAVTGALIGEGGTEGLNVSTVTSLADSCS